MYITYVLLDDAHWPLSAHFENTMLDPFGFSIIFDSHGCVVQIAFDCLFDLRFGRGFPIDSQ